ncbi:Triosephosphate isomerase [Paratrimastix pyriformis]|uniref:Triosephosphate isomerase n=1 Tax=Paratrimastix pyriformis TaxID=342808 RepID=A0SNX0_9EUKA|nr:triosephosphate isomerase [Paratrimastix pyriformis]KAJ4463036.1 Triosephosphate isomerase [Paratrimastix pyriformis]
MSAVRKPWIGGNWKCNGTRASVEALITSLNAATLPAPEAADIVISPPYLFLETVQARIRPEVHVAAQDCNAKGMGAYTGSISAEMLHEFGINTVILGHSERRDIFHETSEEVALKCKKALSLGLDIVPCIGEHREERLSGRTNEICFAQLAALAAQITDWSHVVVAYEPVWAIGTGLVATPAQAQETHAALRGWFREHVSAEVANTIRIVYGGSVSGANSAELARCPDVDGFLVGGASLKPEFAAICQNMAAARTH